MPMFQVLFGTMLAVYGYSEQVGYPDLYCITLMDIF